MRKEFKALINGYKEEAKDDAVGLWQIIGHMKNDFNAQGADVKKLTLEFVKEMLANGFEAGNPEYSATGYLPWDNQKTDYVIHRISKEWDALGKEPNIPDIVWFGLASKYPLSRKKKME